MRLSVHDVGHRVVLRRLAGERDGRPLFSDVLGELVSWTDTTVVIRTAEGTDLAVAHGDVAAAKRIPPRPTRRQPDAHTVDPPHRTIDVLELERICALGWRGARVEQRGGWLLRSSSGWTGRANSALPLGPLGRPGPELDGELDAVENWYAEQGLPALIQLPLPTHAQLRAVLHARGWQDAWGADVKTASCAEILEASAGRTLSALPAVQFENEPSADWLANYHYRGGELPAFALDVLRSGTAPTFASVVEDGVVIAIARVALEEGWIGLSAVEVDPGQRRRGLATHLLRSVVEYGHARGTHSVYLQVEDGNTAAQALYERVGFRTHHTYRYQQKR